MEVVQVWVHMQNTYAQRLYVYTSRDIQCAQRQFYVLSLENKMINFQLNYKRNFLKYVQRTAAFILESKNKDQNRERKIYLKVNNIIIKENRKT